MPQSLRTLSVDKLVLDPGLQAKRIPGQATWDYFHPEDSKKRIRVIRKKDPVFAKNNINILQDGIYMDGVSLVPFPSGLGDFTVEGESILKPLCWQNSSLQITRSLDKVKGTITFNSAKIPKEFDFEVKLPPGCRLDGNKIVNEDGSLRSWIPGAFMQDGTDDPEMDYGEVTFEQIDRNIVRFTPDAEWLNSPERKFPVILDPSVERKGAAYIEDTYLRAGYADYNYGGFYKIRLGYWSGNNLRSLLRLSAAAIPVGTITLCNMGLYRYNGSGSVIVKGYKIKDANDWVEGTSSGAIQSGSCCWNYAKYNIQSWAGSGGCNTSGTDYEPWESGDPEATVGSNGYKIWNIPPNWLQEWRDGINNGLILIPSGGDWHDLKSTDHWDVNDQPYFYIEYEVGWSHKIYGITPGKVDNIESSSISTINGV